MRQSYDTNQRPINAQFCPSHLSISTMAGNLKKDGLSTSGGGKRKCYSRNDSSRKKRKNSNEIKKDVKDESSRESWSKSKKKRMRLIKARLKKEESKNEPNDGVVSKGAEQHESVIIEECEARKDAYPKPHPTSNLQKSFQARLSGSRFRLLNEELYTTTSKSAFERFSENPALYDQYHEGFRHQVEQWPVNPLDTIVSSLKKLSAKSTKDTALVVADFGCGDAQLAKNLINLKCKGGKDAFKVHSFDLVAANEHVTACDMAKVPVEQETVDVGVFCLSLMGTNLADFIRESHRVLKPKGILKIAEVRSRFESNSGNDVELNT
jgi:hypothetical protein